mgnify:CR=1 FL=1
MSNEIGDNTADKAMSTQQPVQMAQPSWHAMPADEVVSHLDTTPSGLKPEIAAARLAEHGPNRLPETKQRSAFMRLLLQFHNVLIYVLLAAALVTAFLQHWVDTAVIIGVVVVNALIGFIQEMERTRFDYDALAVGRYTLAVLPQQLVSLAPVVALLGSIIALASLDRFNELTIISCSGFSRARLLAAIAMPTVLLMIILWLCMEYVTPPLQQSAEAERQALRMTKRIHTRSPLRVLTYGRE